VPVAAEATPDGAGESGRRSEAALAALEAEERMLAYA